MKVKINRNAAKKLKEMLNTKEAEGKMVRVYITEHHGDHVHYGMTYDTQNENDEVVKTDKDVDILLDTRETEFLDGIWIQYFHVPEEEFVITNPSKGHHHH